ncbi:SidA/IucD/PvdA family monooxygenase [Pseudomonas sp.]|uniref:SidA/IucD/PvdA family monooxygenase n=1 Tax=Pseudomonas sp. TaxID=306 RepID=UPI003C74EACD
MKTYDLIGVGLGVFNLGLAALLESNKEISAIFLDKKSEFSWHPGLMTSNSNYQCDHWSDLISMVDCQNDFTFSNYLKEKKITFQYSSRAINPLLRVMVDDYFSWASKKLSNVIWDTEVIDINYINGLFLIKSDSLEYRAKNIVLGVGTKPYIPGFIKETCESVYHALSYSEHDNIKCGDSVAVIGGGQSGAEVVLDVVSSKNIKDLVWVSSRPHFSAVDPAVHLFDIWTPNLFKEMHSLTPSRRKYLTDSLLSTSDGIDPNTLSQVCASIFDKIHYTSKSFDPKVISNQRLIKIIRENNKQYIVTRNELTGIEYKFHADKIILATGNKRDYASLLKTISNEYPEILDPNNFNIDHSVKWSQGEKNKIFIRNAGFESFGIQEHSVWIQSWVSTLIVNTLLGYEKYAPTPERSLHKYTDDLKDYVYSGELVVDSSQNTLNNKYIEA